MNVRPGETQTANYFLGKDLRKKESRLSILPQTIANGIKFGLIIAICAVGLSLIYGTTGLSNFAHGELVTLGAIVAWYFNQYGPQLHILLAAVLGILAAMVAGGASESLIFRPLRRRGVGLTSMMIVSIGVGISARYIFQFVFGGRSHAYRQYAVQSARKIGPIDLTTRSMISMTDLRAGHGRCGPVAAAHPHGQGHPGRLRQPRPGLVHRHQHRPGHPASSGWSAPASPGSAASCSASSSRCAGTWASASCCSCSPRSRSAGWATPSAPWSAASSSACSSSCGPGCFPSVIELKNVGALLALILILLIRPQGILGTKERVG